MAPSLALSDAVFQMHKFPNGHLAVFQDAPNRRHLEQRSVSISLRMSSLWLSPPSLHFQLSSIGVWSLW